MHDLGREHEAKNHRAQSPMHTFNQYIQTHKKTNAALLLALWAILLWACLFLISW